MVLFSIVLCRKEDGVEDGSAELDFSLADVLTHHCATFCLGRRGWAIGHGFDEQGYPTIQGKQTVICESDFAYCTGGFKQQSYHASLCILQIVAVCSY